MLLCIECDATFSSRRDLQAHQKKVHDFRIGDGAESGEEDGQSILTDIAHHVAEAALLGGENDDTRQPRTRNNRQGRGRGQRQFDVNPVRGGQESGRGSRGRRDHRQQRPSLENEPKPSLSQTPPPQLLRRPQSATPVTVTQDYRSVPGPTVGAMSDASHQVSTTQKDVEAATAAMAAIHGFGSEQTAGGKQFREGRGGSRRGGRVGGRGERSVHAARNRSGRAEYNNEGADGLGLPTIECMQPEPSATRPEPGSRSAENYGSGARDSLPVPSPKIKPADYSIVNEMVTERRQAEGKTETVKPPRRGRGRGIKNNASMCAENANASETGATDTNVEADGTRDNNVISDPYKKQMPKQQKQPRSRSITFFSCPACASHFYSPLVLRHHMRSVHPDMAESASGQRCSIATNPPVKRGGSGSNAHASTLPASPAAVLSVEA